MSTYSRFRASQTEDANKMFHWRDNFYVGRTVDGHVRLVKFSAPPTVTWKHEAGITSPTEYPTIEGEFSNVMVILDLRIPPAEWASIVASVSNGGETSENYQAARKLHDEGAAPPAKGER